MPFWARPARSRPTKHNKNFHPRQVPACSSAPDRREASRPNTPKPHNESRSRSGRRLRRPAHRGPAARDRHEHQHRAYPRHARRGASAVRAAKPRQFYPRNSEAHHQSVPPGLRRATTPCTARPSHGGRAREGTVATVPSRQRRACGAARARSAPRLPKISSRAAPKAVAQ